MAAPASAKQQNSRKGRKSHRRSIFCFSWGCCGGVSSRVASAADRGDGKLFKHGRNSSARGKADLDITVDPMLPEMIKSSREIHVLRADPEGKTTTQILGQPLTGKPVKYKTWDMLLDEDNKQMHKSGPAALNSKIQRIDSQNKRLISVHQGRSNPTTTTTTTKLSHSVSLPPLQTPRKKDKGRADKGGKPGQESGELDSMVGAVIITVTLIVMLICGKACAILCTAAWLYFIPHLPRVNLEERCAEKRKDEVDMDSWEYKNKVVLRGLLERSSKQHL